MPGKPNRDRGRRKERAHPSTPREVSVERVDPHTLILRTPTPLDDDGVVFLGDVAAAYLGGARFHLDTHPPAELRPTASGVWLTPDEVVAMEADRRVAPGGPLPRGAHPGTVEDV